MPKYSAKHWEYKDRNESLCLQRPCIIKEKQYIPKFMQDKFGERVPLTGAERNQEKLQAEAEF